MFVIMSGMNSLGRDRSSSMLWFYKINDVETHHAHEKTWFKIYKLVLLLSGPLKQDYISPGAPAPN